MLSTFTRFFIFGQIEETSYFYFNIIMPIYNDCKSPRTWCASLQMMKCNVLTCYPKTKKQDYADYNCDGIKSGNYLPQSIIDQILLPLLLQNSNPTGNWSDFNYVHNLWYEIVKLSRQGYIPCNQIPSQPNPDNYPNLVNPSTVQYDALTVDSCNFGQCSVPITGSTKFFRP